MQNKIMYADNDNYWYYESMDSFSNIGRTKNNKKFVSKSNPFTLRNINVKSYPNIYRAATDSKSSISEIYRIVVPNNKDKNKRTTSHGEKMEIT